MQGEGEIQTTHNTIKYNDSSNFNKGQVALSTSIPVTACLSIEKPDALVLLP